MLLSDNVCIEWCRQPEREEARRRGGGDGGVGGAGRGREERYGDSGIRGKQGKEKERSCQGEKEELSGKWNKKGNGKERVYQQRNKGHRRNRQGGNH